MAEAEKTVALASVVTAFEREIGLGGSRTRSVVRRLSEAKLVPAGAPHAPARYDVRDIATLLIGVCADATLPELPDVVLSFDGLMPGGVVVDDMPDDMKAKFYRAGQELQCLIAAAAEDDDVLRSIDCLEFVSSWPEFAIHWNDGEVQRFREPGRDPRRWGANHMRSIKIPGKALFYAVRRLFADEASADAA